MANMELSPEDREMLAKTKFKQWFEECATEWFPNAFDTRVTETHKAAGTQSAEGTSTTTSSGKTADDATSKPKRSLLSMALEQTLGIG